MTSLERKVDNNELERWTFGINANQLVELVLEGKKTATTYLYKLKFKISSCKIFG